MDKNYFSGRRSVRRFSQEPVSEELLSGIFELAAKAPTCGNMQLYSVVITRNPEMKKKLAELHFNQPAATGSNVILTICADFNLFSRWCEISGAIPGYDNFHSFIMAMTDAIIFAQQITTIAETEGLGTCYLGTVNYTAKEVAELLRLPDKVVPVAALALGYPVQMPHPTDRLPVEAITHSEFYRNDSDEKIGEYFAEKENLPENIAFVEENHKDSLAQVFTDIRYPKTVNETVSKTFKEIIEQKGFEFI